MISRSEFERLEAKVQLCLRQRTPLRARKAQVEAGRRSVVWTPEDEERLHEVEQSTRIAEFNFYSGSVLPYLHSYACPTLPERPATIPDDDDVLMGMVESVRGRNFSGGTTSETMTRFGRWRAALMRAESYALSHVVLLLDVARAFHELDARGEEFIAVRDFLNVQYRLYVPPVPETREECERVASRACRFTHVMSTQLMNLERRRVPETRGGEPTGLGDTLGLF